MTDEEKMVEKFRESGKSQREWCREAGIKRSTLRYWLERREELAAGKEIRFTRIVEGGEKKCWTTFPPQYTSPLRMQI